MEEHISPSFSFHFPLDTRGIRMDRLATVRLLTYGYGFPNTSFADSSALSIAAAHLHPKRLSTPLCTGYLSRDQLLLKLSVSAIERNL